MNLFRTSAAAILLAGVAAFALSAANPKKVACVGNSITYGYLVEDREQNAYPKQLGNMLGKDYEVGNFGRSGATLLTKGHNPYVKTQQFKDALAFKPDIILVHLGVNDTDPRNWPHYNSEFITDYIALIDSFR
ncbi:MAG: sialate O-acetylesterase, partial [Paramuribaculum sp.]|nr:sialate O-acetylesterase [Paramuribaculum sp.]